MSTCSLLPAVSSKIFKAMLTVNVEDLASCSDLELRPVLPSLVRMSLIASLDKSEACGNEKTSVLEVLSRIELVNNIVALLSIDFHALETDVKKEQQQRAKLGAVESLLTSSSDAGPAIDFERSDATRRLRLVLSELLVIMGQIQIQNQNREEGARSSPVIIKNSELFDHVVYLSEICDVLSIAMAELPNLLSPPEVAETLLRLKYGPTIITHIVANQPDCFTEVTNHLLRNGDKQEDDVIRQTALLLLCRMNPSQVLSVRSRCVELCLMPSLAILLTLEKPDEDDDLIPFVSGLLLGNDPNVRNWISLFVRSKRRNDALIAFRKRLSSKLSALIQSELKTSKNVVQGSTLIRLYTALRGISGLKFSDEEINLLMDLITTKPPAKSAAGAKFVSLGLCMVIACNSLVSTPALEKRVIEWIRWLVEDFDSKGNVGEMLLLMAIHFYSQQLGAISDLACQTLGMKIVIRTNGLNKMKHIFTQDIFTDNVVASHAVKVPVTVNLSSEVTGFLPVHCIHQLLKSRAFSKHKVPIKDWIYRQICVSSTPLHPVLPSLIEVYINSILVPASNRGHGSTSGNGNSGGNGNVEQTNEPITEEEIRRIFKNRAFNGTKNMAPQILMLYYILLYDDVRLSHMKSIIISNRRVLRYSQNLLAELPLKFLLQTAERNKNLFGGIFPQLLRLCSTHFPHLCTVYDWLADDVKMFETHHHHHHHHQQKSKSSNTISESQVSEAFDEIKICPAKAILVIQKLLEMPTNQVWPFAELIISKIKTVLDGDTPRQIQDLYKKLWFKMNMIFPRKLWVFTVNAMRKDDGFQLISQDDLIFDPLHVLRCDKRVFTCAPILEILIYLLKACLAASRTHLSQHIQNNPIIERLPNAQVTNDQEREELRIALVVTQESAAVQILLEAGLSPANSDSGCISDIKEIQSLICSYLHETFIADPNLAKLVHFQGYPQELLPITVAGVPSMHICLDFAPELLSQPDLDKQIFAVDLISHLSIRYSLPKSYSTARLAVNALSTLLSVIAEEDRYVLFPPVLPAFVRFCKAFPPLTEDVVSLLLQYGKIVIHETCMRGYSSPRNFDMTLGAAIGSWIPLEEQEEEAKVIKEESDYISEAKDFVKNKLRPLKTPLSVQIQETFAEILQNSVLDDRIY